MKPLLDISIIQPGETLPNLIVGSRQRAERSAKHLFTVRKGHEALAAVIHVAASSRATYTSHLIDDLPNLFRRCHAGC